MLITSIISRPIRWCRRASGLDGGLRRAACSRNSNRPRVARMDAPAALSLLKGLYKLLCYSCRYVLFSGNDSFDSVGIRQVDFFRAVLDIEKKVESSREFVRNSILLALGNDLNTHTLWEDVLEVVVACLETVDMKEMATHICDDLRKDAAAGKLSEIVAFSKGGEDYRAREFVNHLAVLGWMCQMELEQPDDAVRYFLRHYAERNPEITLYVLLRMIERRGCWGLWIRTYEEGVASGIHPREELQRRFRKLREELDHGRRSEQIVR